MARLSRFTPPGFPQHVIQRGNNRQRCFSRNADYRLYLEWLAEYAAECDLAIHAYVLMTNHVHLLVTPGDETSVSRTMQSLGRKYVRYYNRSQDRTGTLWEGRYKSCLVDTERYLMECYRYIELNPVRAGMVSHPSEYAWSSYRANAFGDPEISLTVHDQYLCLGASQSERQAVYQGLVSEPYGADVLGEIRDTVNKGLVLGSEPFKDNIQRRYGRRVRPGTVGRPAHRSEQ